MVAERLAPVDVREVDLDERDRHAGERVAQRDAGVRQAAGVDDDELDAFVARGLDPVDQRAFVVALEARERGAARRRVALQRRLDAGQGRRARRRAARACRAGSGSGHSARVVSSLSFPAVRGEPVGAAGARRARLPQPAGLAAAVASRVSCLRPASPVSLSLILHPTLFTRRVGDPIAGQPAPSMSPTPPATRPAEDCILVLQGGGALGAYQAGVFEALTAHRQTPHWVAGISIGAINAALIAGNPPERRVARLREFWDGVSSPFGAPSAAWPERGARAGSTRPARCARCCSACRASSRRGSRRRRSSRPAAAARSATTTPRRCARTLERLVDFDRLNGGGVRLSVGAVNVRSGNFAYFDSAAQRLDVRHIMASGALPPGLPPVEIDGEYYWDGGLVSNTPLQYVLDQPGGGRRVVFQVDLFPAARRAAGEPRRGRRTREGDPLLQPHAAEHHASSCSARRSRRRRSACSRSCRPALRDDPDAQAAGRAALRGRGRGRAPDLPQPASTKANRRTTSSRGCRCRSTGTPAAATPRARCDDPRWLQRSRGRPGVRVFDLTSADRSPSRLNTA